MILHVDERYNDGRVNQSADYPMIPGETWVETLRRTRYATPQGYHTTFEDLGAEVTDGPHIVNVYPATHQIAVSYVED